MSLGGTYGATGRCSKKEGKTILDLGENPAGVTVQAHGRVAACCFVDLLGVPQERGLVLRLDRARSSCTELFFLERARLPLTGSRAQLCPLWSQPPVLRRECL